MPSINKDKSGFRASGIVPYNYNSFTEEHFTVPEVLTQSDEKMQDSSTVILCTSGPKDLISTTSSAEIRHMNVIISHPVTSL